jgi:hypothetical protein
MRSQFERTQIRHFFAAHGVGNDYSCNYIKKRGNQVKSTKILVVALMVGLSVYYLFGADHQLLVCESDQKGIATVDVQLYKPLTKRISNEIGVAEMTVGSLAHYYNHLKTETNGIQFWDLDDGKYRYGGKLNLLSYHLTLSHPFIFSGSCRKTVDILEK